MNDAVHVQVQVVELHSVGIWRGRVNRQRNAVVGDGWFLFDYIGDREWVTVGEPPVKSWDSHNLEGLGNGELGEECVREELL